MLSRHYCDAEVVKILYLHDLKVDEFQNLISSSLSPGTFVLKFS